MMIADVRTRLESELERLSREITSGLAPAPRVSPDEPAVGNPDASLQEEVRFLGQLAAGLTTTDPATISADRVGYGSTVVLRDRGTGLEDTYTLVRGDFIDLDRGHISLASPLGHALLRRRAGDRVAVSAPGGERHYEVLTLTTLPQRLGLVDGGIEPPPIEPRQSA